MTQTIETAHFAQALANRFLTGGFTQCLAWAGSMRIEQGSGGPLMLSSVAWSCLPEERCEAVSDECPVEERSYDRPIVTGLRGQDEELAVRLVALRPALTRYFLRAINDRTDAEDLVQEVFLRIVRRGELDSYAGFTSYMFLTADSVLKDRNRRRVVRLAGQHVSFDPDVHTGELPSLDRELDARDELRATSTALAQLPERTRSVFTLRRLDGLSFAEIAARLGISVSAAEKHMLRAMRHLLAATRGDL